jgi:hypothetical protein
MRDVDVVKKTTTHIHPKRRDNRNVAARNVCAGPPANSLSKLPLGPINARTRQMLPV